jgi:lipopolysaccharide export system protein LptA
MSASFSQSKGSKIEILRADKAKRDISLPDADKLIGNVLVRHDSSYLECDSAYLYMETNSLTAFSNIKMWQGDSITLTGDLLNYNGDTKEGVLSGGVVFQDNDYILYCDSLNFDTEYNRVSYFSGGKIISKSDSTTITSGVGTYFTKKELLSFRSNVIMLSPDHSLTCNELEYYINEDKAFFSGEAHVYKDSSDICAEKGMLINSEQKGYLVGDAVIMSKSNSLYGDSIYFNNKKEFSEAFDNVLLIDTIENIVASGHYFFFDDKNDYTLLTDSALLITIEGEDSLFFHADKIETKSDSLSKKEIYGYNHAKMYRTDMQVSADSLCYLERDSLFKLFGNPVLWNEDIQAFSDSIYLKTKDSKPIWFKLFKNAFVAQEVDSGFFYNQLVADDVTGYFKDGKINVIKGIGNSESIYVMVVNDSIVDGVNYIESPEIVMRLGNNEIKTVSYLGGSKGVFSHPGSMSKSEIFFGEYIWYDSIRPKKYLDVFIHSEYIDRNLLQVSSKSREEQEEEESKRVIYSNFEEEASEVSEEETNEKSEN